MKKFYHVSLKKNLPSIMKYGLIPQIGDRSKEMNEEKGFFLFPTIDDMNCALEQWLGDWFEEDEILMFLKITLPDDFPIEDSSVEWEKISRIVIPPEFIQYIHDV